MCAETVLKLATVFNDWANRCEDKADAATVVADCETVMDDADESDNTGFTVVGNRAEAVGEV